ncbi:copper amine oxidase N-terminal domain-containing protein [Paenibacillus sp. IITD108]|uniref:copper amine oxidase N-terminal domain-containing protein n=1 Tax=Paenibacillus sp. IITD108 TaxID=3116649 RepID=UPI002F3F8E13
MKIRANRVTGIILFVALALLIAAAAPLPATAQTSSNESKNYELLHSEYKLIDGQMKITADVRVTAGENITVLAVGYDKSGNIIEMKTKTEFRMSGTTGVFQFMMDKGEQLDKVDIQAIGKIEEPYKVLAQSMVKEKDHVEAWIAVRTGSSQYMNVVAKGFNKNGKLVEINGASEFVMSNHASVFKIKLNEVNDIEKVQFLVLIDDQTYVVDYGTYIKNGRLIVTAVVKNGSAQNITSRVTPYDAKGKELNIQTNTSFAMSKYLYKLNMEIKDTSANKVALKFYDETGKTELSKRGILVTIDGAGLAVKQPPVKKDGRVSVPMRDIFEALGAEVGWEQETKTITAARGSKEIILQIGNKEAYIDGEKITIDVAPEIVKGSTMVPIRFVTEALGSKVFWDNDSQTVMIIR